MEKAITILAIETSCDETAVAVIERRGSKYKVLADAVSSSLKLQAKYGGIVPEVAARRQIQAMIPVLDKVLSQAFGREKKSVAQLSRAAVRGRLQAIAATGGPGLITSLLVGAETAKSLAYAWGLPLINVNHLEGHLFAAWPYNKKTKTFSREIKLPAAALIVSGGHTELFHVKSWGEYQRIGGTRDDAAGEAFDKAAKMLGLGYPGGPVIAKLADEYESAAGPRTGEQHISLPRPMMHSGDFDMSFSGIKTSVLYQLKKIKNLTPAIKAQVCSEFQTAVAEVLVHKTVSAARRLGVKSIILGGGVSANQKLRSKLKLEIAKQLNNVNLYLPELKHTGDNAVMIGLAAQWHYQKKNFIKPFGFRPDPGWEMGGSD